MIYLYSHICSIGVSNFFVGLILSSTAAMVMVDSDGWQTTFYNWTMAAVFFTTAFTAIMQSGLVSLAAKMHPEIMQVSSYGYVHDF